MAFSQLLIVMIGAMAVTIVAQRKNIQPPLLLACVGLVVSFVPGFQRVELEPDILLSVVLPPLLFSTTLNVSFISFVRRLPSIINLGVILVLVTTLVVGVAASWAVPGLALSSALVLAAVVAPPDAVTAVAIGRELGLPKRMMTVLTGESLINDAAALTLFSVTVAAVAGTSTFINNSVLFFLYNVVVGVAIGMGLGAVVQWIRLHIQNASVVTALGVLTPFTAYLIAEEIHASGVLAVVLVGFSLGHNASSLGYASRIQERNIWKLIDTLLEAFVFAYIGLQFRFVLQDALEGGYSTSLLFAMGGVVLLAVMLVRVAYMLLMVVVSRLQGGLIVRARRKHGATERVLSKLSWRESVVVGWTGMRGVVTLAAAAGVPTVTALGDPFPGRDAIISVAFMVTIGTLLVQGLTLPWLIRRLKVRDPNEQTEEREQYTYAHQVVGDAVQSTVTRFINDHPGEVDERIAEGVLKRAERVTELRNRANAIASADEQVDGASDSTQMMNADFVQKARTMRALSWNVLVAQREALVAERDAMHLDDDVMRNMLEHLDLQEAFLSQWKPRDEQGWELGTRPTTGGD